MLSNKSAEKCLIIIPAKGRSRGIPQKNMALLGGKPLLEYSILSAKNAGLPGKICLSTDDAAIADFAAAFGIDVPFIRPVKLAQDDISVIPVIKHALEWYEKTKGFIPEYIVLLQPTNPFRSSKSIKDAYKIISESGENSLISVNHVQHHPCEYIVPQKVKGFEFVMTRPKKSGRQNFPTVYFINGAIYISRASFFKKNNVFYDKNAILHEIAIYESIDIDTPSDLEYANWICEQEKKIKCRKI